MRENAAECENMLTREKSDPGPFERHDLLFVFGKRAVSFSFAGRSDPGDVLPQKTLF